MAYEMTICLTDEEYRALATEAAKSGKRPETLLHDLMLLSEANMRFQERT